MSFKGCRKRVSKVVEGWIKGTKNLGLALWRIKVWRVRYVLGNWEKGGLFEVTFEISKADCNGNGISLGVCERFSGGSLSIYMLMMMQSFRERWSSLIS